MDEVENTLISQKADTKVFLKSSVCVLILVLFHFLYHCGAIFRNHLFEKIPVKCPDLFLLPARSMLSRLFQIHTKCMAIKTENTVSNTITYFSSTDLYALKCTRFELAVLYIMGCNVAIFALVSGVLYPTASLFLMI